MDLKLNKEIFDAIKESDVDSDVTKFLIASIYLEAERYKDNAYHFFKDYDKMLDRFIKD
ncbi:MAG: hypothetical protein LBM96_09420 [Methanobrevibacter sp.]|jgi:hypothetical protein|nr:hypothetical protein [Candidatus Methanoflexus mossambicus]